jgi:hypothetical protein
MVGPWAPNDYLASNPLFGLAASPPLGDIPSALQPRLPPHGKIVNFIFLTPPHGNIDFLFASRLM